MGVFCSVFSYTILHHMLLLSDRKDMYILLVKKIMTSLHISFNTVLAYISFEQFARSSGLQDRSDQYARSTSATDE